MLAASSEGNSTTYDFRALPRPSSLNGVTGYDIGAIQYQGESDDTLLSNGFDGN